MEPLPPAMFWACVGQVGLASPDAQGVHLNYMDHDTTGVSWPDCGLGQEGSASV